MIYFTTSIRDNGDQFTKLTESAPDWVKDAVREAHGDKVPDDYIYEWCSKAFIAYDDYNGNTDAAISDIEPDCYYYELGKWFTSDMERAGLVDEILQETDVKDVYAAIGMAQVREKESVYNVVFSAMALEGY